MSYIDEEPIFRFKQNYDPNKKRPQVSLEGVVRRNNQNTVRKMPIALEDGISRGPARDSHTPRTTSFGSEPNWNGTRRNSMSKWECLRPDLLMMRGRVSEIMNFSHKTRT